MEFATINMFLTTIFLEVMGDKKIIINSKKLFRIKIFPFDPVFAYQLF